MRHGRTINHLSRKSAHRKALLANLASSLIMHKRIKTTTAKAKVLRTYIEPVITRSKEDSTSSRRLAFSYLGNKIAVSELFREVSSKIGDRPGGYTRIIKLDSRSGDNADMCLIELVDYNENLLGEKEAQKAKTGRKRRSKKKPAEAKTTSESVVADAQLDDQTDTGKITEETADDTGTAGETTMTAESTDPAEEASTGEPSEPAEEEKAPEAKSKDPE